MDILITAAAFSEAQTSVFAWDFIADIPRNDSVKPSESLCTELIIRSAVTCNCGGGLIAFNRCIITCNGDIFGNFYTAFNKFLNKGGSAYIVAADNSFGRSIAPFNILWASSSAEFFQKSP